MTSSDSSHPSDLQLDLLMAGELEELAAASARKHLTSCPTCTGRWTALEADRDRYRTALPLRPRPTGDPARARPAKRRHRWRIPVAAAAAAALLLIAWPRKTIDQDAPPATSGDVRTKGGPSLGFYRSRDGRVTQGASGDLMAPADEVRFAVTADRASYLVIAGVDASGRVAIYFPEGAAGRAAPIEAGTDQLLPGAIALDEAPGPERIIAFFCRAPVEVASARAAAADPAPHLEGCQVDRLEWEKRAR